MGTFSNVVSGLAVIGACVAGYKDFNAGRIGAGLEEFTQVCTSPTGAFQRITHCSGTVGAGIEVLAVGVGRSLYETAVEVAPKVRQLVSSRPTTGPAGVA